MPEEQIQEGAGMYDFAALMGQTKETEEKEDTRSLEESLEKPEEEVEETPAAEEQKIEEETPAEETPAAEEEQSPEEEPSQQAPSEGTNEWADLAKKYIEIGTWQDAEVEIEGEEVKLSELENLDKETFLEIVKAQDAKRNDELNEKFINKEDLDDISLKIIDISKNGGDIKDVLKAKETYIDNLNTYDLENEDHQELLVRQMYQMNNPNFSEKQIDNLVNTDKSDLELDTKAKEFADNLKASYNKMLDDEKQNAEQQKVQQEEERKQLRKGMRESLKEFGLDKESAVKPLIDSATKEGEDGLPIDKQYAELKKDPKQLAEFALWLNNREDYKSKISEKQSFKDKKDTMVKLNLLKGKKDNKSAKKKETVDTTKEELNKRLKFV